MPPAQWQPPAPFPVTQGRPASPRARRTLPVGTSTPHACCPHPWVRERAAGGVRRSAHLPRAGRHVVLAPRRARPAVDAPPVSCEGGGSPHVPLALRLLRHPKSAVELLTPQADPTRNTPSWRACPSCRRSDRPQRLQSVFEVNAMVCY